MNIEYDISKIARLIEEKMLAAGFQGQCETWIMESGGVAAHFVFDGGHPSPIRVGGRISENRPPEHFAKMATIRFLRHPPVSKMP